MTAGLVLASGSPRRADLLTAAGIAFQQIIPGVAETADPHLTAREATAWNALKKGLSVARKYPTRVVVAADTVVVLDGVMIGKPRNFAHATRILRQLNGRTHEVFSSVFVGQFSAAKFVSFCEVSHVRFRKLTELQIREYLGKINPLDKAGGYAAQGDGKDVISEIDGSFSNVVGLPMERTVPVLKGFGIQANRTVS